jgi:hypothetical protein
MGQQAAAKDVCDLPVGDFLDHWRKPDFKLFARKADILP